MFFQGNVKNLVILAGRILLRSIEKMSTCENKPKKANVKLSAKEGIRA
jgi:hypothetical protein